MKKSQVISILPLLAAIGCVHLGSVTTSSNSTSELSDVYLLNRQQLASLKSRIRKQDPSVQPMARALEKSARKRLECGPFSVTFKEATPPSDDKHDYTSLNPYRWPNPNTRDGLPYEKRDGEINPESNRYGDETALIEMTKCVETLALANYLLDDAPSGRHGAELIRAWFITPKTRMNPNLKYAEIIPGSPRTSGVGTNQTREFLRVIDAVGLLEDAGALSEQEVADLRSWFSAYLDWLIASAEGRDANGEEGNIATLYRAQLVDYALFSGRSDVAKAVLHTITDLIVQQVEPDGSQPVELKRTRSWNYSHTNLRALFHLATLGDHLGVDLWHAGQDKKRGIRAALDFLVPYARGDKVWPFEQIQKFDAGRTAPFLFKAAAIYHDQAYLHLADKLAASLDAEDQLMIAVGSLNAP